MSDHGIVGMGLVYVNDPSFLVNCDKSSTCNLECSFSANSILNAEIVKQNNVSHSLLPSLSLFMEVI